VFRFGVLEIIGLAICPSPHGATAPFTESFLPLHSGVNVLYGLNGAGKSLLLEALGEIVSRRPGSRSRGLNPELVFRVSDSAFRTNDDWYDTLIRHDAIPFYRSFGLPHADWLLEEAHDWDEQGHAWMPFEGGLERMERAIAAGINQSAYLPDGIDADALAGEMVNQRLFSLGSPSNSKGLMVRATPEAAFPVISEVLAWRDGPAGAPGRDNLNPIQRIWGSCNSEDTSHLPPLYTLIYQQWPMEQFPIPIAGVDGFEADAATAEWLRLFHARIPKDLEKIEDSLTRLVETAIAIQFSLVNSPDADLARDPALQNVEWIALDSAGSVAEQSGIALALNHLIARASSLYARLLIDAPILEVNIGDPKTWIRGLGLQWGARRSTRSPWIPLEHLSQAERKWAVIAIELALHPEATGFLLIDEPEQALHRSAEAYMARGLTEIAAELNLCVVVASHSPELLNLAEASVHCVRRMDQGFMNNQQIHPIGTVQREQLDELGLLPGDLLRRQRGFLLVEGQHDAIVLQTLIGPALAELRVEILPLRGAGRLKSTLDSRVLYDFTDAHIFVMLDALDSVEVSRIWHEACRLAKNGSHTDAITYVLDGMRQFKADEAGMMSSFMTRAIERGLEQRHSPVTLNAKDILEYLPVEKFVAGASSWDDLRDECQSSISSDFSGTQFKNWLRNAKKADLSEANIRLACQQMDEIPSEFTNQLERMRKVLSR
jgi:predicted ATPase